MIPRAELIRALVCSGDADFELARSFAEQAGFDLLKEDGELRSWCTELAQGGNLEAQHALAKFLRVGLFGSIDRESAFEWCSRAAEHGYLPALHMLSTLYGDMIDKVDDAELRAIRILEKAAGLGYAPASRSLGVRYLTGAGVNQDSKIAYSYLEDAAEKGDAYSQLMVGRMLIECGEPEANARGISLIKASADSEFPSAMRQLATFYKDGSYGFPKDERMANQLLAQVERREL